MEKLIFSLCFVGAITFSNAQDSRRSGSVQQQRGTTQSTPSLRSTNNFVPSTNNFQRSPQSLPESTEWRNMSSIEKRETVRNLSPTERTQLMQNIKENIMIDEIQVPTNVQEEFKELFNQYMDSQSAIKEKFKDNRNKKIEKLTNDEAQKKLDQSFDVGLQLLNNRKTYAEKFLKILTPQQVLKLFSTEGKVRDKMLDKKYDTDNP